MDNSFWLIEKVFTEHLPALCSTEAVFLPSGHLDGKGRSTVHPSQQEVLAVRMEGSKYRWESREGPTALPDGCGSGVSDGYGKTRWPGPNSGVWQS